MPTRNVVLTKHQEKVIQDPGRLRLLPECERSPAVRVNASWSYRRPRRRQSWMPCGRRLALGFGALDRGEFKLVQAVVGKSAASLREV